MKTQLMQSSLSSFATSGHTPWSLVSMVCLMSRVQPTRKLPRMHISIAPSSAVSKCDDIDSQYWYQVEEYEIQLDLKYESARQFYIKIPVFELEGRVLPPVFTNVIRRKNNVECQTLELMKRNQKVTATSTVLFPNYLMNKLCTSVLYYLLMIVVNHINSFGKSVLMSSFSFYYLLL